MNLQTRSDTLRLFCILAAFLSFSSFSWAVKSVFVRSHGIPNQMKVLSFSGILFFLAQIVAITSQDRTTTTSSTLGIGMYLSALALFFWAIPYARANQFSLAFSKDQPTTIVRTGPYRFIRHPFYCAYLLFWIAGIFAAYQPFLILSVVVMGSFYLRAIVLEEKCFLRGPLGREYAEYCQTTGRLIPRFRSLRPRISPGPCKNERNAHE
jgi:protein-S-isoprenylcysteine O-methyltransferase Ste14